MKNQNLRHKFSVGRRWKYKAKGSKVKTGTTGERKLQYDHGTCAMENMNMNIILSFLMGLHKEFVRFQLN